MTARRFLPRPGIPQIPAVAQPFMLLTLFAALLLHWSRLPLAISLFSCAMLLWRFLALRRGWPGPGKWLRTLLALSGIGVFVVANGLQMTVESALAFFVMTYSLKLIELDARRDAMLYCFLSFFLIALAFLFDQSLLQVLAVLCAWLLPMQALEMLFRAEPDATTPAFPRSLLQLRRSGRLMLAVLPLVALLYLFFPRFGPLWSMPLKSDSSFTGLSDTMTPGTIADLAQSRERAFRAVFSGPQPATHTLYWQALALDYYDGRTWRQSFRQINLDNQYLQTPTRTDWDYEIILEPHNRNWAFNLAGFATISGTPWPTASGLARFPEPVKSITRYRQAQANVYSPPPSIYEQRQLTRLPNDQNPRLRTFVADLQRRAHSEAALIEALLEWFSSEPFYYSLQPPLAEGRDSIDLFMFDTREGFCEHYAGAMTYALRLAGIPARVMTGYQGGEFNQDGRFWTIYQYDAHAWVEAWLPGQGWLRLDPTSAVAPERIQLGLRGALSAGQSRVTGDLFGFAGFPEGAWLNWLRLQMEYGNYLWQNWVINFSREDQLALLPSGFDWQDLRHLAALMAGLVLALVVVSAALVFWLGRRHRPALAPELRLAKRWQDWLVQHADASGAASLRRLSGQAIQRVPGEREHILSITTAIEQLLYGNLDRGQLSEQCRQIDRMIHRLEGKT